MEGEIWKGVYQIVMGLASQFPCPRKQLRDSLIVLTFLWAVLHDRPTNWACQPESWPADQHHRDFPSAPTMSRRLRTESIQSYLVAVEREIHDRFPPSWCKWMDGLPLPIGGASQDRHAGYGYAAGGIKAYGYKLHVICDGRAGVECWRVYPMNVSEKQVAKELIRQLTGEGYLVGDGNYDTNPLYELAANHGYQFLATKRFGGLGHRRHSKHRLRGIEMQTRSFGKYLLQQRFAIDRFFGQWGCCAVGLSPLPHWVRGDVRVPRWVQGKIIINAVRHAQKQRLIA
jgi:hypothetical protein